MRGIERHLLYESYSTVKVHITKEISVQIFLIVEHQGKLSNKCVSRYDKHTPRASVKKYTIR